MKQKVRVIAYYLPQFHPIPENDIWWGKGFTEWTNVGKAKPLFNGHYQPRIPADLGYYDLRVPETRQAQADMAKEHGVEGFCYWHYWFGNGKRLLERPFNEVLESGKPDFPFCLAWANETWKGFNHGLVNRNVLIEQTYPGEEDYISHFYSVLPAFKDKRYITVDEKPLFVILKPHADAEVITFMNVWRKLALENGLAGIYFVGHSNDVDITLEKIFETGVDAVNTVRLGIEWYWLERGVNYLSRKLHWRPITIPYRKMVNHFLDENIDSQELVFPSIVPGWDHTPRSGFNGLVYTGSTPELFRKHVNDALNLVGHKHINHKIIFIKSWNEWAEGNHMEPDLKYGSAYLKVLKECLEDGN